MESDINKDLNDLESSEKKVQDDLPKSVRAEKTARKSREEIAKILEDLLEIADTMNTLFEESVEESNAVFTPDERRRMVGVGMKTFSFYYSAYQSATNNKLLIPSYLPFAKFENDMEMYNILKQFYDAVTKLDQNVYDTMLLYADMTYADARAYYQNVKEAANQHIPGASVEYNELKKYFSRSKRKNGEDEPSNEQIERDVRSVLHGRKDGKILLENESPTVIKGKRVVIDDIHKDRISAKESDDIEIDE